MTTKQATTIASRAVATYLIAWVLSDATYLPGLVYSFIHYVSVSGTFGSNLDAISLSFHAVRICVLLLAAQWFLRAGPSVHEFLLGTEDTEDTPPA